MALFGRGRRRRLRLRASDSELSQAGSHESACRRAFQVKRKQVEGSYRRSRGAIAGGGEQSQFKLGRSNRRWRERIAGGGERSQVEGSDPCMGKITGGGERSQVEGSDRRCRGEIKGGGEQSKMEGSDRRWREVGSGPRYMICVTLLCTLRESKNTRTCVCVLTFKFSVSLSAGGLASVSCGPSRRVRVTVSFPNQPGRPCLANGPRVAAADSPAPESTIIQPEDSDGLVSGRLSQSGPCLG